MFSRDGSDDRKGKGAEGPVRKRKEEIGFVAFELALGGFLLHHHHHHHHRCGIFCVLCLFISRSAKPWAGGYLLQNAFYLRASV